MAMLGMTTRQGMRNIDLNRVMDFLTTVADADQLKELVADIRQAQADAVAEQEKALEYAGNAKALKEAKATLAAAAEQKANSDQFLKDARMQADRLLQQARDDAQQMIDDAERRVTQLKGDIEAAHAKALSAHEQAEQMRSSAQALHERNTAANEEAERKLADVNERLEQARRLFK